MPSRPGGEAIPFPPACSEPSASLGQGLRSPGRAVGGVWAERRAWGRRGGLDPCIAQVSIPPPPPADPLLGGPAPERERAGEDAFPAGERGEAEEPDGVHLLLGQRRRLQRGGRWAPQPPRQGTDAAGRWGPWHGCPQPFAQHNRIQSPPSPGSAGRCLHGSSSSDVQLMPLHPSCTPAPAVLSRYQPWAHPRGFEGWGGHGGEGLGVGLEKDEGLGRRETRRRLIPPLRAEPWQALCCRGMGAQGGGTRVV